MSFMRKVKRNEVNGNLKKAKKFWRNFNNWKAEHPEEYEKMMTEEFLKRVNPKEVNDDGEKV